MAKLREKATELIVNRDSSDHVTITNTSLAMNIEQFTNFYRSGFESLKLWILMVYFRSCIRNLIYKYSSAVDHVLYEETG